MHSAYGTRLLSIGEIFDRAVHLTIANLLPLVAIVGLVAVPVRAIIDWIDRDDLSHYFGALGKMVADPRLLENYFTLIQGPHSQNSWTILLWTLATLLPLSLAVAAASIASEKFLKGERITFRSAYLFAFRRLAPIIGSNILAGIVFIAAVAAVIVVVLVLWFVWLLIITAGGGTITTAQVHVLFPLLVPTLVLFAAMLLPLVYCTTTGPALYAVRPFRALRDAWTMTMSRGLRGRSYAFGAAIIAFSVVELFISSAVCGVLANVTHTSLPSFVARNVISMVTWIFTTALGVVFYLDARNRVGLIQEALAERENSQAQ